MIGSGPTQFLTHMLSTCLKSLGNISGLVSYSLSFVKGHMSRQLEVRTLLNFNLSCAGFDDRIVIVTNIAMSFLSAFRSIFTLIVAVLQLFHFFIADVTTEYFGLFWLPP